jgi:hypothetical protein
METTISISSKRTLPRSEAFLRIKSFRSQRVPLWIGLLAGDSITAPLPCAVLSCVIACTDLPDASSYSSFDYRCRFNASPSIRNQGQQAPAKNKSDVAKQSPVMRGEPSTTVVNNPGPTEKHESPKEQSKWWIPPPPWDIYWPTIGLVIGTGFAEWAALKTLRAINAQVLEMRETGKQTDKLIAESIAQTQTLVQQAESLGRTTPEFRVEFDKVWWGFLSLSDSV